MSCVKPLTAYWRDRSRSCLTFDKVKSLTKIPFNVPCGRCIGCRMEKARQWGLRCMHEKRMWPHSCFVTLTYNDEFLPPGGSLSVRDVQLFMKRLRKAKNSSKSNPVRFFLGGEYGELNRRPHYHALLFNVQFGGLRTVRSDDKFTLYSSDELSALWSVDGVPMGHCSVGELTYESAVYCAKYALKKYNVDWSNATQEQVDEFERRYVSYDGDGRRFVRRQEFSIMSRRPGIGAKYYEKFGHEIRAHDNVISGGRPVRVPRFYDTRTESIDPARFSDIKRVRKRAGVLAKPDNTPERLRVKQVIMEQQEARKERKL